MRPTINADLANALYAASTAKTDAEREAATMKAADLYGSVSERDLEATERYVRSCLVTQGLV